MTCLIVNFLDNLKYDFSIKIIFKIFNTFNADVRYPPTPSIDVTN